MFGFTQCLCYHSLLAILSQSRFWMVTCILTKKKYWLPGNLKSWIPEIAQLGPLGFGWVDGDPTLLAFSEKTPHNSFFCLSFNLWSKFWCSHLILCKWRWQFIHTCTIHYTLRSPWQMMSYKRTIVHFIIRQLCHKWIWQWFLSTHFSLCYYWRSLLKSLHVKKRKTSCCIACIPFTCTLYLFLLFAWFFTKSSLPSWSSKYVRRLDS